MNKIEIVELMQRRTTKLAVLSVVFVGMIVFLVPTLVEEADAIITAKATSTAGPFSNVLGYLEEGLWTAKPKLDNEGNLFWVTRGKGWPFPGTERGYVFADVGQYGKVQFLFNNPASGQNDCYAVASGPIQATCHIPPRGSIVDATYTVSPKGQENGNSYCEILNKYGGEKTKDIREKLHC
jgi:hypothetical protein